ncbi:hypothetical protein A1Q1_01715 [Trichosporon asahii var. asahii CBS 2479]|uniref:Uncharacterized protein n=1 Tax=Trichosporon asahii var. asahii (strain ATCC 90039 / CBS 2479 / JCM 2466 / KCTC 7840 / NBRC 103889/ NCYC 2677 / UAMH 7654) TaxID=1186058 RepID=J6EX69_TRIAS|nr:hypothetical protein A1Q1_01715 [Trichosporon asahii var. asahii CBS 2479]EJT49234.1 hypothetical protein A1Q1_01715 [Trichosporon asahii var. asahii CBS 2479]
MTSIVLPNMPNTSLTPEAYTAAATRGPRRPVLASYEAFYRLAESRTTTKVVAGTLAKMTFESSGVWCSGASVVLARFPESLELNAIEDQAARRTCHQVAFWMMTD